MPPPDPPTPPLPGKPRLLPSAPPFPPVPAELTVSVSLVRVSVPPPLEIAPPEPPAPPVPPPPLGSVALPPSAPLPARLAVKVLSRTVRMPLPSFTIAPPGPPAPPELPERPESPPAPAPAALSRSVLAATVRVSLLRIAPPLAPGSPAVLGVAPRPPWIVMPASTTVTGAGPGTSNARSMWLASTVVARAPAPMMSMLLVRSRSPVAFVFSPAPVRWRTEGPAGSKITSVPDDAPAAHSPATAPEAKFELAAVTASRSEQDPSLGSTASKGVLTLIWVAAAGDASARDARRPSTAPLVSVMSLLDRGTRLARVVASCACSPRVPPLAPAAKAQGFVCRPYICRNRQSTSADADRLRDDAPAAWARRYLNHESRPRTRTPSALASRLTSRFAVAQAPAVPLPQPAPLSPVRSSEHVSAETRMRIQELKQIGVDGRRPAWRRT